MFPMEYKVCIKISRHSKHLPPWFVTNVCINLPFGLSFCHESLRSGKHQCVQFFFHSLEQTVAPESPRKWIPSKSTTDKDEVNRQNCSFSDGICPAQLTFIIVEQPSVMVIAEVNGPLIRLGCYGSACCQSRLKTLCSSSLPRWKYSSKAKWSCLKSAMSPSRFMSRGGLGVLLAPPGLGRFSKVVFRGILKSGQVPKYQERNSTFSILSYTDGRNQFLLESSHHIVLWVWGDNVCESALKIGNLFMEVGWLYCYCQTIKFSTYCQSLKESLKPFLLFQISLYHLLLLISLGVWNCSATILIATEV